MKRVVIGLTSALILSGCGTNIDDLVAYTEQVKANTQVSIEPYPEFSEFESVNYGAMGGRSPFMRADGEESLVQIETTPNCAQPIRKRTTEPLERFGLDALQMSGVISINGKRFALIKANDESLHRVTIGNYMGLFHGRVTRISQGEVTIQEMLPDGAGCWQSKTATLSMSSATGEDN